MSSGPDLHERLSSYMRGVFGCEDTVLAGVGPGAAAAGLPAIAVSPETGAFLRVIAAMACGDGPAVGVEVGTLAGYSGTWIARGMGLERGGAAGGRLYSVEFEPRHAEVARETFRLAGVGAGVEVVVGAALEVLPGLLEKIVRERGARPLSLVFLDAVKPEYSAYARLLKPHLKPGGVLLADNALGSGSWFVSDAPAPDAGAEASRAGVDEFNRMMAADRDFVTACVPVGNGVLVARRAM